LVEQVGAGLGQRRQDRVLLDYFAPLVSFAGTPYWSETNLLTNRVPRNSELNRGSWYGLEWAVRNLANRLPALYVITGPVYEAGTDRSGDASLPDGFFKVIADETGQVAAFVFPQQLPFHIHHCDQLTTLEEVERVSGLDLFPELSGMPRGDLSERLGCFR
ncbi:MAG: DNA/RNA non-specific endonuclease, partial [Oceanisphaera sp.]|nr:DNA/RNA non-specific endonuclease [Oceanisphaera sp.]